MGVPIGHHTIRRVLNRFRWKDDVDLDTDGGGKRKGLVVGSQSLASGVAYCISSCSMILLNKLVLSGFRWEAQITLMLYQVLLQTEYGEMRYVHCGIIHNTDEPRCV